MRTKAELYWNKDLETITPSGLKKLQSERLSSLMEHAYARSEFYRNHWDAIGLRPSDIRTLDDYFKKVPFITKSQIIENQAQTPPFGTFLAESLEKINRTYYSPGPLLVPFSRDDYDHMVDQCATCLYICGAREEDIVDITFNYHWVLAGTTLDSAFRRIGCNVIPGGVGQTKTHVEILKLTRATIIFAFPTFAQTLAQTALDMGLDPAKDLNVRLIIITGEIRSEQDKVGLAKTFGAEVRELYATNEIGWVAAECEYGGGMHFYADNILEIIDPQTKEQVQPGISGEIVSICFGRKVMPIIRYRTGDLTEGISEGPCPCGRHSPKIKRILGRVSDIPRIKGMFVAPRQVAQVVERFKELGRFQIIVDRPDVRDELIIRIEHRGKEKTRDLENILISELKAAIRLTARVELVEEGSIPPDEPVVQDRRKVQ